MNLYAVLSIWFLDGQAVLQGAAALSTGGVLGFRNKQYSSVTDLDLELLCGQEVTNEQRHFTCIRTLLAHVLTELVTGSIYNILNAGEWGSKNGTVAADFNRG